MMWGDVGDVGAARLYVVVDTSVLLSHWSFIQALHRNLGQDGAVAAQQAGTPGVQVLLVVPWAVLVELDKLKEERSVLRIPGLLQCISPHIISCFPVQCPTIAWPLLHITGGLMHT